MPYVTVGGREYWLDGGGRVTELEPADDLLPSWANYGPTLMRMGEQALELVDVVSGGPLVRAVAGAPASVPEAGLALGYRPNFGYRASGEPKGFGYFGALKRPGGGVSTELSVGVKMDGKETEIPLLVPGLTQSQIDHLLAGNRPTSEIVDIAVSHAKKRLGEGKSPFAGAGDEEGIQVSLSDAGGLMGRRLAERGYLSAGMPEAGGEPGYVSPGGGEVMGRMAAELPLYGGLGKLVNVGGRWLVRSPEAAVLRAQLASEAGQVKAYHGSPTKGIKAFSNEKIGTGEGAQAFGYGHYMTEDPGVAKYYAEGLTKNAAWRRGGYQYKISEGSGGGVVIEESRGGRSPTAMGGELWGRTVEGPGGEEFASTKDALAFLKQQGMIPDNALIDTLPEGEGIITYSASPTVYPVTIHAGKQPSEYTFLEWEKPVTEKFINALRDQAKREGIEVGRLGKQFLPEQLGDGTIDSILTRQYGWEIRDIEAWEAKGLSRPQMLRMAEDTTGAKTKMLGEDLYLTLENKLGSQQAASEFLSRAGISGIKYPAGTLSGVKSEAYNYVVFDPKDITMGHVAERGEGAWQWLRDKTTDETGMWAITGAPSRGQRPSAMLMDYSRMPGGEILGVTTPSGLMEAQSGVERLKGIGLKPNYFVGDIDEQLRVLSSKFQGLSPEGMSFVNKFGRSGQSGLRNKSAIHWNEKTGLSVDFSTTCPCQGHPCPYCYVEQARTAEQVFGMKGGAKKEILDLPYNREILAMPPDVVNWMNQRGGLRMFSFSDFRPGIDDARVAMTLSDAEAKGLYVKAITKQPEFVMRYGDHPNLRVNISIDNVPKAVKNAPSIEQAVKLQAGRDNIKIRAVALNEKEALEFAADPRVDVVTMYHGLTREKLRTLLREQNPGLEQRLGTEEFKRWTDTWQDMPPRSNAFKRVAGAYPNKVCCQSGSCAGDKTKCGFGLGLLGLALGVHLPEIGDNEEIE